MARISRPPGFDMTYRPEGSVSFGPPVVDRMPGYAYLAVSLVALGIVLYGPYAGPNSFLYEYIVVGDQHRIIPALTCALVLVGSAVAAVLRTQMRGVVVHPDGIEMRKLATLGVPRIRRFAWSQIDRIMVPSVGRTVRNSSAPKYRTVGLDLWDGSRTWLPEVHNLAQLSAMVEHVALARAIPIDGGAGNTAAPFEPDT